MTFHEWFKKQARPFTAAEIWRAADRHAREECAAICDRIACRVAGNIEKATGAMDCEKAIRESMK
jgi:hypothetical protein